MTCRWRQLFRREDRADRALLATFLLMNGIVLWNACSHDPFVGYDAVAHLQCVETLARGRLPGPADSYEYFSPPLPYLFPALLMSVFTLPLWWAAKAAQVTNVLLSLGVSLLLLEICEWMRPGGLLLKRVSLLSLAIVPAYYRSFAFVRGEPYLAFLALFAAHQVLRSMDELDRRHTLRLGFAMGAMVLARQWGIMLLPAIGGFFVLLAPKHPTFTRRILLPLAAALAIALAIGGWFYLNLSWQYGQYGGALAFNRPQARLSLANQPRDFYVGLGDGELFTEPIRPAFPNQLLPILYADLWGDYWAYFLVYAVDARNKRWLRGKEFDVLVTTSPRPPWLETNRETMGRYLGRVNAISLPTSLLFVVAVASAIIGAARFLQADQGDRAGALGLLILMMMATSVAGYGWFLLSFPIPGEGDTIKATYMVHLIPLSALLIGCLVARLAERWPMGARAIEVGFWGVLAHHLPALLSGYT